MQPPLSLRRADALGDNVTTDPGRAARVGRTCTVGMVEHLSVATDASWPGRRAVALAGDIAVNASEVSSLPAVPRGVPSGTLDLEESEAARGVVEAVVRALKDRGPDRPS